MNDTVAYVQGLTFALSPGASAASVLADESTDAGKVWATTLKTYLDLPHTGAVRWGLLPEEPHKTKLLIGKGKIATLSLFTLFPCSDA